MTLSRMAIPLPITVPINPDGTLSIHIDQDILFRAQNYIYDYTTGTNQRHDTGITISKQIHIKYI